MTEGEKRERRDAERFVWAVMQLPKEVGFSMTRPTVPEGAPQMINPYTCVIGMPGSGHGSNPTRLCEAHGATMYEALMRALADAHESKALNIRLMIEAQE